MKEREHILERISEECGIAALSKAVSQLLDRIQDGAWKDVITTAEAVRILLLTGTSRNSETVRRAIKWLREEQDANTGSWNDEVWDTAAALRTLRAVGLDLKSDVVKKGIHAIRSQYDPRSRSWWDVWDSAMAIQCFIDLGLEDDMVRDAIKSILDRRYPPPDCNWLNLHTTALAIETLSSTELRWENRIIEAKDWLKKEVTAQKKRMNIWNLALAVRALNCYAKPEEKDFLETLVRDRIIPAINEGKLDSVDLCQVSLTLIQTAPTLMKAATVKAVVDLAEKDQKGLADLFTKIACSWEVGGLTRELEEKAHEPYVITFGLTKRHLYVIGVIGTIASVVGLALYLLDLLR
jgi:hypothetical protein